MATAAAAALSFAAGCAAGDDARMELRQYMRDEQALLGHSPSPGSGEAAEAALRLGDAGIDDPYGGDARRTLGGSVRARAFGADAEDRLVRTAKRYLGTPYEYGSDREEASTFDGSDFVQWVYAEALGLSLPRDSRSQAEYVRSRSSRTYTDERLARPGDLLFFTEYRGGKREDYEGRDGGTITHVGLALGNGRVIHALSQQTGGVRIDSLRGSHLEWRFAFGGSAPEAERAR